MIKEVKDSAKYCITSTGEKLVSVDYYAAQLTNLKNQEDEK